MHTVYNIVVTRPEKSPSQLLHEAGLRRTSVRLAVLAVIEQSHQPLGAPQILELLPQGIDRVTLYRTLNTLTGKKLLHRVRGDDQVCRYGFGQADAHASHSHAHFVCDKCGTVECLSEQPAPAAPKRTGVRAGYRVDYSEVLVHGACPDCR